MFTDTEKLLKSELFLERTIFVCLRVFLLFGLILSTAVFILFTGATLVESFRVPSLFGAVPRYEILGYGTLLWVASNLLMRAWFYRFWFLAWQNLSYVHQDHLKAIHQKHAASLVSKAEPRV